MYIHMYMLMHVYIRIHRAVIDSYLGMIEVAIAGACAGVVNGITEGYLLTGRRVGFMQVLRNVPSSSLGFGVYITEMHVKMHTLYTLSQRALTHLLPTIFIHQLYMSIMLIHVVFVHVATVYIYPYIYIYIYTHIYIYIYIYTHIYMMLRCMFCMQHCNL